MRWKERLVPAAALLGLLVLPPVGAARANTITVDATPAHAVNQFNPLRALGAGVDAVPAGTVDSIYTPANVTQQLTAGWGAVTYRLYTELSVQDWHWNPNGTWSGSGNGYWTGATVPASPIQDSFAYKLAHRGFTHDQGNDEGYSRLDDGDPTTYRKSNPYLSAAFTGESDALHPQWAMIDLGAARAVNAVRIVWSAPYATQYAVQYWTGDDPIYDAANGQWQTFPIGTVTNGAGGTVTLSLSPAPLSVRYVRILMSASSNTCDSHGSSDPRHCVGYAIAEVGVGRLSGSTFTDLVRHAADNTIQTVTYASSVDSWHQVADQVTDEEQPGLDLVFTSGLTQGLPATVPVAMAYGTPGDAAAEIAYLEAQHYPIARVELGEEADEQLMNPEDYGALYLQWATALHTVDPTLLLGGPVFAVEDPVFWPDTDNNTSWLNRFLNYLSAYGRLSDFAFFSLEHYPFDPCRISWRQLLGEPATITGLFQAWASEGLPASVPVYVTEYNVSYDYTSYEPALFGALWHADFLGSFLSAGGSGAFFYQYEALPLGRASRCSSWGTFSMFTADASYDITAETAQYFSTQLATQQWAEPVDAAHHVFPVASDVVDRSGNVLVTAYAVQRPDGQWALLLINKDRTRAHAVSVNFHNDADNSDHAFAGSITMVTLAAVNYLWHPRRANGFPSPDGPLMTTTVGGGPGVLYTLPHASIVVLRGVVS
ncbi:MAG: discoidin domain-containing protein [Candidatus Binatia bacterium]